MIGAGLRNFDPTAISLQSCRSSDRCAFWGIGWFWVFLFYCMMGCFFGYDLIFFGPVFCCVPCVQVALSFLGIYLLACAIILPFAYECWPLAVVSIGILFLFPC